MVQVLKDIKVVEANGSPWPLPPMLIHDPRWVTNDP